MFALGLAVITQVKHGEIAKDEEASLKEAEKRREFKADGRFIELKN